MSFITYLPPFHLIKQSAQDYREIKLYPDALYLVTVIKFNSDGAMAHLGIPKGYHIRAKLRFCYLEKTAVTFKTSLNNAYTSFLIV